MTPTASPALATHTPAVVTDSPVRQNATEVPRGRVRTQQDQNDRIGFSPNRHQATPMQPGTAIQNNKRYRFGGPFRSSRPGRKRMALPSAHAASVAAQKNASRGT